MALRIVQSRALSLPCTPRCGQRQRPAVGLICRSERGSQYAAKAYRKQLADLKATPSMSRTGCCNDNAPMESFFHTLKVNLPTSDDATRHEARRDLFAYIEGYYNRQRIHSALGYINPKQAERNADHPARLSLAYLRRRPADTPREAYDALPGMALLSCNCLSRW